MKTDEKIDVILMVDDDPDDCAMVADAVKEQPGLAVRMQFVHDGESLAAYLRRSAPYDDDDAYPRPGLILLDLSMPRKDGFSTLVDIRSAPKSGAPPVVVFSTSRNPDHVDRAYRLGAASYLVKPDTFDDLVTMMRKVTEYWFGIVRLPAIKAA